MSNKKYDLNAELSDIFGTAMFTIYPDDTELSDLQTLDQTVDPLKIDRSTKIAEIDDGK